VQVPLETDCGAIVRLWAFDLEQGPVKCRDQGSGKALRRLLKFLHTMGAIGFMGSMGAMLVLMSFAPSPNSLATYALFRGAMAAIATWIFLPSLALTMIAGLLAIAVAPAFHEAGWAWLKAATGILIFAGGLHVLAPIQDEAKRSADALAGQADQTTLDGISSGEPATLWVLLVVSTANVVLGIWRPRLILTSPATGNRGRGVRGTV
jgi:hypothetical protein